MMDAFNNGLDIHSAVMSDLTGMPYDEIQAGKEVDAKIKNDRVAIKRVNFGILYGVQAKRLQRLLRIELGITQDIEYCKEIINKWLSKYTKVKQWIDAQKIQAACNHFVAMPLGQKRRLPEASFDRTKEAAHALAQATNFPVQSLASWICLIGLIILDNYWEVQKQWMDAHTIMQVHDSVTSEIKLIESPYNLMTMESIKEEVKKIMETETLNYLREVFGVNFNCPLVFDTKISERWS
jgi:DNA polymerase-1